MRFGRIELLLLSELARALLDLLEQVVGLLEAFVFLELGLLLFHFLAERFEGCLGLLRVLRGGTGSTLLAASRLSTNVTSTNTIAAGTSGHNARRPSRTRN